VRVTVNIINAFGDNADGGNPAGVVLDADTLTDSQKLTIAKKVDLSETAFVSKSLQADYKLDFFTPTRQIAHCGHATIAVFSHLSKIGMIGQGFFTKETIDGNRKILIDNDVVYMEQLAPTFIEIGQYNKDILDSIGITEEQLIQSPKIVNTGNSFVIIGVKSEQILSGINPNMEKIISVSESLDLVGYYLFTPDTRKKTSDAATRAFGPRYGINEDAATGMAAGPLACYLFSETEVKKEHLRIEQGYLMKPPSPSEIQVNLEVVDGTIVSLMAGGSAKLSKEIVFDI
jgi:PhzF family phenazine biosynthesis protein